MGNKAKRGSEAKPDNVCMTDAPSVASNSKKQGLHHNEMSNTGIGFMSMQGMPALKKPAEVLETVDMENKPNDKT